MKTIFSPLILSVLLSGCLVPGAPLYYRFRIASTHKADSVMIVSFPGKRLQYRYRTKFYDSVFVANAMDGLYIKMKWDRETNIYTRDVLSQTVSGRRKNEKSQVIYLKKHKAQQVEYDTLFAAKPPLIR